MSDPNTTTSGLAKPSKSAGLSFYNRFACGAAALLALATAMILVSTSQASQSARDTRDEAHTTLQQAGEELAPYWCSQITPDNVKNFDDLYSLYLDVKRRGPKHCQAAVREEGHHQRPRRQSTRPTRLSTLRASA